MLDQPLGPSKDYVIRVHESPKDIASAAWNGLLTANVEESPFIRHAYLLALHESLSATAQSGWTPRYICLWKAADHTTSQPELLAACPLYVKDHSYGEYVFDWAWAQAYQRHGMDYYPKATVAVPFTPVPGARLLARNQFWKKTLLATVVQYCEHWKLSSLHLLFLTAEDLDICLRAGLMPRQTVQFHWDNRRIAAHHTASQNNPNSQKFDTFEAFLSSLNQEKRKKIRQERRKVVAAGVVVRAIEGPSMSVDDWDFFYDCYTRTYLEHGNPPYLTRRFFVELAQNMPQNWVMFVAERAGLRIACSLIAVTDLASTRNMSDTRQTSSAYGRYWGAIERVDCLHFELCYYSPINWCIEQGINRFEGGAQGEHKMARALLPVVTYSAHWVAHPGFAQAISRYVEEEGSGVEHYLQHLQQRSPMKSDA